MLIHHHGRQRGDPLADQEFDHLLVQLREVNQAAFAQIYQELSTPVYTIASDSLQPPAGGGFASGGILAVIPQPPLART